MLPAPPFQLLERYDVVEEIGRGGHAVVFRAHDRQLARDVAIKVLREDVVGSADVVKRFMQEIQLLATLEHAHILHVHDSGTVDGQPFVVMELAPQATLARRLTREAQLPIADAVQIAREVGSALAHAHARGILHRDVKPENILLGAGGAVLADFGIARVTGEHDISRITSTGEAVGTLQYMSPEQLCAEPIDARSDQYALGLVFYEMLSGVRPHAAPTIDALRALRVTGQHVALSVYRSAVSPALEAIIARMMAVAPADRFRSLDEFLMALSVLGTAESPTGSGGYEVVRTPSGSRPAAGTPSAGVSAPVPVANDARKKRWVVASAIVATMVAGVSIAQWADARGDDGGPATPGARVVRLASTGDSLSERVRARIRDELAAWSGVEVRDGGRGGVQVSTTVTRLGDSVQVRLQVRDSAGAAPRDVRRMIATRALDSATGVTASMTREILAGRSLDSLRGLDGIPTRSLPALRAYVRGFDLLYDGQLDSASAAFRAARDAAPGFAAAHLWAAQSAAWSRPRDVERWREDALRATESHGLAPLDSLIAQGLAQLATGALPRACVTYEMATHMTPTEFAGWMGRATCEHLDSIVNKTSTGLTFRGGIWHAVAMYQRAASTAPTARLLGAVSPMMITATYAVRGQMRRGRTLSGTRVYALPARDGDSLAFYPVDSIAFARGAPGSLPATWAAATRLGISAFVRLTTTWTSRFPDDPRAWLQRGSALELAGFVHRTDAQSAEAALDSAQRLGDARMSIDVDMSRLRLAVRRGSLDSAVLIAHRLLRTPSQGSDAALAPQQRETIAAFAGDSLALAEALATAYTELPVKVREPLRAYRLASLLGTCDGITRARGAAVAVVQQGYPLSESQDAAHHLLDPLDRLSAACVNRTVLRALNRRGAPIDPVLMALGNGEPALALTHLRTIALGRAGATLAEVSWDALLLESWATAAAGDTAAAVQRLVAAFDDLASMSATTFEEPEAASGLRRSLQFLVVLAGAADHITQRLPQATRASLTRLLTVGAAVFPH